jgi:acetyl-CoA synthetase
VRGSGCRLSEFWAKRAREFITWKQPFTQALDESNAPFFKWFADGKLNVSYNCLDRQVEAGLGDKVAIIFEADNGEVTKVTYKEMLSKVASSPMPCAAWASRRAIASSSTCR